MLFAVFKRDVSKEPNFIPPEGGSSDSSVAACQYCDERQRNTLIEIAAIGQDSNLAGASHVHERLAFLRFPFSEREPPQTDVARAALVFALGARPRLRTLLAPHRAPGFREMWKPREAGGRTIRDSRRPLAQHDRYRENSRLLHVPDILEVPKQV